MEESKLVMLCIHVETLDRQTTLKEIVTKMLFCCQDEEHSAYIVHCMPHVKSPLKNLWPHLLMVRTHCLLHHRIYCFHD